jgi:hypothetical protein
MGLYRPEAGRELGRSLGAGSKGFLLMAFRSCATSYPTAGAPQKPPEGREEDEDDEDAGAPEAEPPPTAFTLLKLCAEKLALAPEFAEFVTFSPPNPGALLEEPALCTDSEEQDCLGCCP